MRKPLITIILILPIYCQAQTTLLPNWLVDSLIFESKQSRQCLIALDSQTKNLESQGRELLTTTRALKLSQDQNSTLKGLLQNAEQSKDVDKMQYDLDRKILKRKIKKRNVTILGESLVIVGLMLLL